MRIFFLVVACILVLFPRAALAAQRSWPMSDISVTIPASAGSECEAYLNLFRQGFAKTTGHALVEKFFPAEAGASAWAKMIDDVPDGSALTVVLLPNLILRTHQLHSGVNPAAMAIVHIGAYSPSTLWIPDTYPFGTFESLVDAVRNTDGDFLVAGPGRYSAAHAANLALDRFTGVRTLYIPLPGTVEAGKAVLNRQASVFWGYSVPPVVFGSAFRALAVASEKRLPLLPRVPTFLELGIDLQEGVYIGIAVPADTPEDRQEAIAKAFSLIASGTSFKTAAVKAGFIPLDLNGKAIAALMKNLEIKSLQAVEEYSFSDQ